ncbi:MAG: helix-turn-helix domain-containing protein [Agathobacter sp.]|nr:helix-turn-helix domain-containing protein [Agathobacter sp.]
MEIGSKIKEARMKIELTQEQVAEALGVSRQTISNWETGKSYPDIVSVIKMSDLYEVSLDYLLKGKEAETMTNYINYLEESTNTVRSKQRFSKLIQIGIYVVLWSACLLWFWIGRANDPTFAPAFALMTFYLILPVVTFVISILIGKDESWGRYRWCMALFFGVMYSLESFGTFSMANTLAFANQHFPTIKDAIPGVVISLIGMGIGVCLERRKQKKMLLE